MVKLKVQNPHMKFRVELSVGGLKEDITTTERTTQGLEAPETFWVELEHYPAHLPPPKPEEIVYEMIKGQKVPGVIWFANKEVVVFLNIYKI